MGYTVSFVSTPTNVSTTFVPSSDALPISRMVAGPPSNGPSSPFNTTYSDGNVSVNFPTSATNSVCSSPDIFSWLVVFSVSSVGISSSIDGSEISSGAITVSPVNILPIKKPTENSTTPTINNSPLDLWSLFSSAFVDWVAFSCLQPS